MALVMFATSVNLAIDMHYCQGQLKSVSFLGKAKNCHDIMAQSNCPHHQKKIQLEGCSNDEKDCCDNKTIHIQSDNDQINSGSKFIITQKLQHFVVAFVTTFLQETPSIRNTQTYQFYKPPIVLKDILVHYQSFLI